MTERSLRQAVIGALLENDFTENPEQPDLYNSADGKYGIVVLPQIPSRQIGRWMLRSVGIEAKL